MSDEIKLKDVENDINAYFATHNIPTYFYQCLFGECVKIWGMNLVAPCDTGDSYQDQISEYLALTAGTAGWNVAFYQACVQCDMVDMYEYYSELDWIQSDIFDGVIVDNMIKILFSENVGHDYYCYRLRKEKQK